MLTSIERIDIEDEASFQKALRRNKTIPASREIGCDCRWRGWEFSHRFLKNAGCKSYEDLEAIVIRMGRVAEKNDRKKNIKKASKQWSV